MNRNGKQFVYLGNLNNHLQADIQLGSKVIKAPFYGVSIKSAIDIECLQDAIHSMKLKNTQCVSYTIGDALQFRNVVRKSIFEFTGERLNFKPFSQFVLVIDPTGEYIQFDVKNEIEKLQQFQDIPTGLKDILNSSGTRRKSKIERMFNNEASLSGIIQWYMDKFKEFDSVIKIPPCLPIFGEKTLKYAITMNRIANVIQQDRGWHKAIYFLIDFSTFKKADILSKILLAIRTLGPEIVVFKVYNPDFCKDDAVMERTNLQYFLEGLRLFRLQRGLMTFALNTDSVGYHYLAQGVCGIVEPISGNFKPDIRRRKSEKSVNLEEVEFEQTKHGKYPDPLRLYEVNHDTLRERSRNNKSPFPCHCPECSKYRVFVEDARLFNRLRRKHRIFIRDRFIDELVDATNAGTLKVSMFDRLSESPAMSKFKVFYE